MKGAVDADPRRFSRDEMQIGAALLNGELEERVDPVQDGTMDQALVWLPGSTRVKSSERVT